MWAPYWGHKSPEECAADRCTFQSQNQRPGFGKGSVFRLILDTDIFVGELAPSRSHETELCPLVVAADLAIKVTIINH